MTIYGDFLTKQKIESGKINLKNPSEDEFYDLLDLRFNFSDNLNEDIFQYQNFFPHSKDVADGKWIKVPTEIGYNIYYAKPSKKKPNETTIARKVKKIEKQLDKEYNLDKKLKLSAEIVELNNERLTAQHLELFDYDLKYARVRLSKSKYKFLLPYEYEVVNSEIEEYLRAQTDSMNKGAVKFKHIFSSENEEQIFYLRSRGIPKYMAMLMADLKNAYFIIDTQAMLNEAIQFIQPKKN